MKHPVRNRRALCAAGVLLVIAGCAGTQSAPQSTAELENTYWKLLRLGEDNVATGPGQREVHMILQAPPDGPKRVAGFSGCNHMTGGYTLAGDQLAFTQLAGTLMACPEPGMRLEQNFHATLLKSARWAIRGEQLDLFDAAGQRIALFESVYLR